MFIFAVRFKCKSGGNLYMAFWVHKVLGFKLLINNVPIVPPFFQGGGMMDFVFIEPLNNHSEYANSFDTDK